MSIFTRIFKIGQAATNKVIDGMENPELMLDQAIRDKDSEIRDAKKAVQSCIASEREVKTILAKEEAEKGGWESKAEAALRAGNEALATKALLRATEHEQKSDALRPQWEAQKASVEKLKLDIHSMEGQLAEYKRNRSFILAQNKAAIVKKQVYEAKAKISKNGNSDDLMARMKEKAERNAHEADAAEEMANEYSGGDALEKEFKEIDSASSNALVADKMAALKAKIAK